MRLSKHFIDNWQKRVGKLPTPGLIRDIIADSIRVHKGMKLRLLDGTPFNTLTIFWHPDLKLILMIDLFSDTAVSVLSDKNRPGTGRKQALPNYTPLTMHNA